MDIKNNSKGFLCVLKEKYFTFKGRLNRKPFLIRNLILFALSAFIRVLAFLVLTVNVNLTLYLFLPIVFLYVFFSWWASLSLTIRRLHDVGYSAKTVLFPLIFANIISIVWVVVGTILYSVNPSILEGGEVFLVIVGLCHFILFLFLLFKKGNKGTNRFGEDPLELEMKKFMEKFNIEYVEAEDLRNTDRYFEDKSDEDKKC